MPANQYEMRKDVVSGLDNGTAVPIAEKDLAFDKEYFVFTVAGLDMLADGRTKAQAKAKEYVLTILDTVQKVTSATSERMKTYENAYRGMVKLLVESGLHPEKAGISREGEIVHMKEFIAKISGYNREGRRDDEKSLSILNFRAQIARLEGNDVAEMAALVQFLDVVSNQPAIAADEQERRDEVLERMGQIGKGPAVKKECAYEHCARRLKADYVEVALVHAFTRGTPLIRAEAEEALKELNGEFTADVLADITGKCAAKLETCCGDYSKAKGKRTWAVVLNRQNKRAEAHEKMGNIAESASAVMDTLQASERILTKLKEGRSDLTWKPPREKHLRKAVAIVTRHRAPVATV